jgi:hypothetical protein
MKVIIAGSRHLRLSVAEINVVVDDSGFTVTHVVEGGAPGVDRAARRWARAMDIPYTTVEADWAQFGRGAGPRRNRDMAEIGGALIAIPVGESPGTESMIREAKRAGLPVHVHRWIAPTSPP